MTGNTTVKQNGSGIGLFSKGNNSELKIGDMFSIDQEIYGILIDYEPPRDETNTGRIELLQLPVDLRGTDYCPEELGLEFRQKENTGQIQSKLSETRNVVMPLLYFAELEKNFTAEIDELYAAKRRVDQLERERDTLKNTLDTIFSATLESDLTIEKLNTRINQCMQELTDKINIEKELQYLPDF